MIADSKPGSRKSSKEKRNVHASQARTVSGFNYRANWGDNVDYAEIAGCPSVDDGGTSDTVPAFPLIVILLRWKCVALT